MKKSLLAVAVVAALPVVAQAQTNVTMFGLLDASLGFTDRNGASGAPGRATQLISGVVATNRWGVRGSEDLGGGLSAVFHLEGRVGIDDGSGTSAGNAFDFQRRAVVGLSGGFGTVVFGRDYTPGFLHSINTDQGAFGHWGTNLSNWTSVVPGLGAGQAGAGAGVRWNNGIHYSGTFGPIGVRAAYSTSERDVDPRSAGNGTAAGVPLGNNIGISVQYAAGPLSVHGFYHDMKDAAPRTTATKQSGAGASYQVGPARLMLGYVATDPDGEAKLTGVSLGANIALGGGTLGLQGHRLTGASIAGAAQAKGTAIGINYTRPMSRRTDLYFSAGVMRNNDVGSFALRASDFQINPAAAGNDPRAISFGVLHRF